MYLFSGGGGSGASVFGATQIVSKSGAYTALPGDFIVADATSAGFAVNLPNAPAVGSVVWVKKIDSSGNAVTVTRQGSDTIDGANTLAMNTQWEFIGFIYAASLKWYAM